MTVATYPERARSAVPPGPRFRYPLRFFSRFRDDPLRMLSDAARCGPLACLVRPPMQTYVASHPDLVRHVLLDNHRNYWKGLFAEKMRVVTGQGLIFTDGELWRRQRALAAPAFYPRQVARYARQMTDATNRMLERWQARANGEPFDVTLEMSSLTLDIVGRALFGTDVAQRASRFHEVTNSTLEYVSYRINHLFTAPPWLPTARNRRLKSDLAYANGLIEELIAERRAQAEPADDLLSALLAARDDDTNEGMTDRQLRDELFTFIGAGFETSSVALSWTWVLLSQRPEARERLRAELDATLGGRVPGFDDLERLPYTRRVLQEALRLYPPAWGFSRQAHAEDELDGYRIPPKSLVMLVPWVTHRLPEFWDDPDVFDPDRFLPERSSGRHRFAWFPFGGGPRTCIGNHFAMLELMLVLATVAQRFELDLVPGHPIAPDPVFALRLRHGARVRLRPLA